MDGMIHRIITKRHEELEGAILMAITEIGKDNEITVVDMNETAIANALMNATPGKPVIPWDRLTKGYCCPKCFLSVYMTDKYCSECGKKLDWSDEK